MINDYYKSLSRTDKGDFIRAVMNRCGISYNTFLYKMKRDSWSLLERKAVIQHIKERIKVCSTNSNSTTVLPVK